MHRSLRAISAVALLSSLALAQAPTWLDFGTGTSADDVTVVNDETIVVGRDNSGGAFRWSSFTGFQLIGGYNSSGALRISDDGTVVMANHVGLDGTTRASIWTGGSTWSDIPGIGGVSGNVETTGSGLSGDGTTVVGLGWATAGTGHAFRSSGGTTTDLTPPFSMPSSRAHAVNDNGNVVVGWDQPERYGARWVNGLKAYFVHTAPNLQQFPTGEAYAVNGPGTVAVGTKIFTLAPSDGWRWDAGTNVVTRLSNLAGSAGIASPTDLTDDGMLIVGHDGGNLIFGTLGVVWVQNQPMKLYDRLVAQGCVGVAAYADVGYPAAISGDGTAVCGVGTGVGTNQPMGGWVAYIESAMPIGTIYCAGDGTGTACPCGNNGLAENGCANSVNSAGAHLAGEGYAASLANDSLVLLGTGMPNSSALYFQGTTRLNGGLGSPFGDGLRCVAGTIVRLGTKSNAAGESQYPAAGDASVSVRGLVTMPGTRTYQCWYRNAAAYCTTATFNLTNAVEIAWTP